MKPLSGKKMITKPYHTGLLLGELGVSRSKELSAIAGDVFVLFLKQSKILIEPFPGIESPLFAISSSTCG